MILSNVNTVNSLDLCRQHGPGLLSWADARESLDLVHLWKFNIGSLENLTKALSIYFNYGIKLSYIAFRSKLFVDDVSIA